MQHPAWGSFAQSEPHGGQPALTRLRSIWSALLTTQFLSERVASDLLDHGPRPPDDECLAASSRSELRRSPPELSAPLHQRLWLSRAGRWSTRYFTATTFATIGFGDLKPARPEASTEEDHEKTMPEGFFLDFLAFFEVRRDLAACWPLVASRLTSVSASCHSVSPCVSERTENQENRPTPLGNAQRRNGSTWSGRTARRHAPAGF